MRKRGTVSTLRLLAATAFAPSVALAQSGAAPLRSIDIYGSSVLDSAAVRAEFEPDLVRFIELGWQAGFGRDSAPANAPELEAEMEATSAKIRTALESRARISTTPAACWRCGRSTNKRCTSSRWPRTEKPKAGQRRSIRRARLRGVGALGREPVTAPVTRARTHAARRRPRSALLPACCGRPACPCP
jgi:hypothetical protein